MPKILVTGANGQLGSEIRELIADLTEYEFIFTDLPDLDITDHGGVEQFIEEKHIDLIINCAAYTAVDRAEEESELADKINHLAVKNFPLHKLKGPILLKTSKSATPLLGAWMFK